MIDPDQTRREIATLKESIRLEGLAFVQEANPEVKAAILKHMGECAAELTAMAAQLKAYDA